jgi:hypothetical protein
LDLPPIQVTEWKKPKILSLARGPWNISTQKHRLIPPKDFALNLVVSAPLPPPMPSSSALLTAPPLPRPQHDRSNTYQFNYRAEVLRPRNLPHLPKPHKFRVYAMAPEERRHIEAERARDAVLAVRSTHLPPFGFVWCAVADVPPACCLAGPLEARGGDARAPQARGQAQVGHLHGSHQVGAPGAGEQVFSPLPPVGVAVVM